MTGNEPYCSVTDNEPDDNELMIKCTEKEHYDNEHYDTANRE